jgi:hypothetical protein
MSIEIDLRGKQSGRGAYLCPDPRCWHIVLEQNRLGRALKCTIRAQDAAKLQAFAASLADGEPGIEQPAATA